MYLILNYHREKYYVHLTLLFNRPCSKACCNQSLVIHSDLKKHNVLRKKNKCNVNLNNIASVQNNYLSIFMKKNWLKRIVNIIIITIWSHFNFVASLPVGCVYFCLDYQTKKLILQGTTPYQARHGNISFVWSVTRLFKVIF